MVKNGLTFNPERVTDFRRLGGNHIIIETSRGFAVLAHARAGAWTRVENGIPKHIEIIRSVL